MNLVLDMGGTYLRVAGCDDSNAAIGPVVTFETPNYFDMESVGHSSAHLADFVVGSVEKAANGNVVDTICFGFPGPVDKDGNILAAPTVWGRQARMVVPFAELIRERRRHWKVHLINDLAAAGYNYVSETRRDFLIVTVGSGVGSKVFLDAKPVVGVHARGGEIGHLQVDFSDLAPLCDCGGRGHIGAISSGRGVERLVRTRATDETAQFEKSALYSLCGADAEAIDTYKISLAFHDRDPWVLDAIHDCARPLAQAFASIHLHCGIERFIVTGGFAQALGDPYRDILCELASSMTWSNGFEWRRAIHLALPDEHPGLNGARKYLDYLSRVQTGSLSDKTQ